VIWAAATRQYHNAAARSASSRRSRPLAPPNGSPGRNTGKTEANLDRLGTRRKGLLAKRASSDTQEIDTIFSRFSSIPSKAILRFAFRYSLELVLWRTPEVPAISMDYSVIPKRWLATNVLSAPPNRDASDTPFSKSATPATRLWAGKVRRERHVIEPACHHGAVRYGAPATGCRMPGCCWFRQPRHRKSRRKIAGPNDDCKA
jgi:hypothetical protein